MNRVILYHARLPDRLAPDALHPLLERIPYAKRVGLAARREDREASLAGIALALAAAASIRGRAFAPEALRFVPGAKPRLASPDAPVFSISHSGRDVVAAAAARGDIGVDVEREDGTRLAHEARREWSAREAAVKAVGLGLRDAPGVRLAGASATVRGRHLHLQEVWLAGVDAWLATDFEPSRVELRMLDLLDELRRHAA